MLISNINLNYFVYQFCMYKFNFLDKIRFELNKIIVITLIVTSLAGALSLIQPLKYRSSLKLLVVQENTQTGDTYTLMRSNEYLGKLLANVTYSTGFAEKVFANSPTLDRSYFGDTPKKLATNWTNSLDVKNLPETGIIEINAYHSDREQTELLARSIGANLIASNAEYHGLGEQVKIKILDEPITTNWPVKPNLPLNLVLGLISGLALSLAIIYFSDNQLANYTDDNYNFAPHLAQPTDSQENDWESLPAGDPIANDYLLDEEANQFPENSRLTDSDYYQTGRPIDHLLAK